MIGCDGLNADGRRHTRCYIPQSLDSVLDVMLCCFGRNWLETDVAPTSTSAQNMKSSTHVDGTHCEAGTQKIPKDYQPCCGRFGQGTLNCEFDIRFEWWARSKSWVVRIPDGGSSGMDISFCPYCGTKL